MTIRFLASCSMVAAISVAITGCASPLPQYAWKDAPTALRTMNERDGGIRTFSATCRMLLESGDGRVELTGAIVARPPHELRLRAWKFSQAVFDITLNEDGLFVLDRKQAKPASDKLKDVNHTRFVDAIALLPGFERDVEWQAETSSGGRTFTIRTGVAGDDAAMECTVDRRTLVKTGCVYRDDVGHVRQSLSFGDYVVVGDAVWPMRVEGNGESGSFVLLFDRIEINVELAARAFVPPRRAIRQP